MDYQPLPKTKTVAERKMTRTRADGVKSEVVVRIGEPTLVPDGRFSGKPSFYCSVEIVGLPAITEHFIAYSVDSCGALTLALMHAGVILGANPVAKEIDWYGAENFGFPAPIVKKRA